MKTSMCVVSSFFFFHIISLFLPSFTHQSYSLFLSLGNSYSPTRMLFFFSTLLSFCPQWFSLSLYIEFFNLLLTVKNVTSDVPPPFFFVSYLLPDLISTLNAIDKLLSFSFFFLFRSFPKVFTQDSESSSYIYIVY